MTDLTKLYGSRFTSNTSTWQYFDVVEHRLPIEIRSWNFALIILLTGLTNWEGALVSSLNFTFLDHSTSHVIYLYIIRHNNISWKPHNPHPKIWGSWHHQPPGLTSMPKPTIGQCSVHPSICGRQLVWTAITNSKAMFVHSQLSLQHSRRPQCKGEYYRPHIMPGGHPAPYRIHWVKEEHFF